MSKADGDRKTQALALIDNNLSEIKKLARTEIGRIAKIMPGGEAEAERYIRIAVTHYVHAPETRPGEVPALHRVEPRAYFAAVMDAATDRLMPDGRDGWIIPYNTTCRWHPSWRGLVKLARRVATLRDLSAEIVYAKDLFKVKLGGFRELNHEPYYSLGISDDDRGPVIAAYAGAKLADDNFQHFEFRVVTRARLDKVKEMSGDPRNKTPSRVWVEHEEAMQRKHAMRQFLDWIGTPDEVAEVFAREDAREETAAKEASASQIIDMDDRPVRGRRLPADDTAEQPQLTNGNPPDSEAP